jgi:hypothetical protein
MASHPELPDNLAAFLLLHATISARDEDLTRQGLRAAAVDLPHREAVKVALSIHASVSPTGKAMLRRLA